MPACGGCLGSQLPNLLWLRFLFYHNIGLTSQHVLQVNPAEQVRVSAHVRPGLLGASQYSQFGTFYLIVRIYIWRRQLQKQCSILVTDSVNQV